MFEPKDFKRYSANHELVPLLKVLNQTQEGGFSTPVWSVEDGDSILMIQRDFCGKFAKKLFNLNLDHAWEPI